MHPHPLSLIALQSSQIPLPCGKCVPFPSRRGSVAMVILVVMEIRAVVMVTRVVREVAMVMVEFPFEELGTFWNVVVVV